MSVGILDDDEHHLKANEISSETPCHQQYSTTDHVDDGEDPQDGGVLEEVNTLGEAQREDEEDGGCRHYEVSVKEPMITELVADQTVESSVELVANDDEEGDAGPEGVDGHNDGGRQAAGPASHGEHDVLEGEGLLDVAGAGQDDEGGHDEDQEDGLHDDGRGDPPGRVEGAGEVEEPSAQGRIDYQENSAEC